MSDGENIPPDDGYSENEETERARGYEQSGSLGTGTQGDSTARELAERESDES